MSYIDSEVVVITGTTSGIGLSIAEKLSKNDYKIIINGRNNNKLDAVSQRLCCDGILGDISKDGIPEMIFEKTISKFGKCDVLINNAGIMEVGKIEEINIDRMCEMIKINVEATFRLSYLFLRHFLENGKGHLINISSILGTKVREKAGAYAATKFAIEAFSESLRMELAKTKIKVTCIEPGLVTTELHRKWTTQPSEQLCIPNPLKPGDIADVILWILKQSDRLFTPKILIMPKEHKI